MSRQENNRLDRADSRARIEIQLHKSKFLENIVSTFGGYVIDWERLRTRLTEERLFSSKSTLAGYIGEEILQMYLDDISAKFPDKIKTNIVEDGTETDNYKFRKVESKLIVYRKRLALGVTEAVTDYDSMITIDGTPVIWEVKLYKDKFGTQSGTLNEAISPGKIAVVTHPIIELFGVNPGLVMVVLKDMKSNLSPEQQAFRRMGYMVRIPVSGETLHEKILEYVSG